MSWRILIISTPAQVSVKMHSLVIDQKEKVSIPLEDISVVVLDSYGIQLSAEVLMHLIEYKTTMIVCDQKHLPVAQLLPYEPHSRQLKVLNNQLSLSEPFKKRLWQKIIQQKIINQGYVLSQLGFEDTIGHLASTVQSGDSANREAYASRLYFSMLLGKNTTRKDEDKRNAALNFGYSIIRSLIARNLASYGFLTSMGVHHKNELNSYNLADDFIEPYRPIVDLFVYNSIVFDSESSDLSKEERYKIIDILNFSCKLLEKFFPIKDAIELTIKSFISAINEKDHTKLLLPSVSSNNEKIYESHGNVRSSDEDKE